MEIEGTSGAPCENIRGGISSGKADNAVSGTDCEGNLRDTTSSDGVNDANFPERQIPGENLSW